MDDSAVPYYSSPLKRVSNAGSDTESDSDTDAGSTSPTKRQRRSETPEPESAHARTDGTEEDQSEAVETVTEETTQDQGLMDPGEGSPAPTHNETDKVDQQTTVEHPIGTEIDDQMLANLSLLQEYVNSESKKKRPNALDLGTETTAAAPLTPMMENGHLDQSQTPPPTPRMESRQLPQAQWPPQSSIRPPPGFEFSAPMTAWPVPEPYESSSASSSSDDSLSVQHGSVLERKPQEQTLLGPGRNWKDPWFYSLFCSAKIEAQLLEIHCEAKKKQSIEEVQDKAKEELQGDEQKPTDDIDQAGDIAKAIAADDDLEEITCDVI